MPAEIDGQEEVSQGLTNNNEERTQRLQTGAPRKPRPTKGREQERGKESTSSSDPTNNKADGVVRSGL